MARGRPAARATATPKSARLASLGASESGTGRSARSTSTRSLARSASGAADTAENIVPPVKRSKGRPSRASLVIKNEDSPGPSAASTTRRASGRLSKVSAIGSASVSSVPTPVDASSDSEYSTPGTSNVPTPAAADKLPATQTRNGNLSNIEVRLPARSRQQQTTADQTLRDSVRSLKPNSTRKKAEIEDSDDDDDGGFYSTASAIVARRLQKEEYAKADETSVPRMTSIRRSGRVSTSVAPSSSQAPTKRPRASTGSSISLRGPAKRNKIVPDSEDAQDSDIDMDAEYAAGAALDFDELADASRVDDGDDVSLADTDEASDEDYTSDEDSDVKPLMRSRAKTSNAKSPFKKNNVSAQKPKLSRKTFDSANDDPETGAEPSAQATEISDSDSDLSELSFLSDTASDSDTGEEVRVESSRQRRHRQRRSAPTAHETPRLRKDRQRLEKNHPVITTMWDDLEKMPLLKTGMAPQPLSISRQLKPFQLEGLAWMKAMEVEKWKGGLLGDEMGLGKTIQAVSLIMSDYPAKDPSLVLVPPVALMQWQSEIKSYTDGTLKTFVFHGTNQKAKGITAKELKKYDIIMMSYNSLESMYRKQEKGFKRKDGIHKEKSVIHSITFHRAILDEAHSIKTRTTMTAKACFALKARYRWCLTGTPLQNRIGEFFSLIRFLNVRPFASYLCKQCPCSTIEWNMDTDSRCTQCSHAGMQHVSLFNHELLNPIQKYANMGPGREAFMKLRLLTERIMLRRLKKDHTNAMELPVKEVNVDRQFFGEEENDFASSIMTSGQRKFDTYVAQGVLLNNYANIFGLIMQMRQVADHPDLLLKKNAEGGQNVLVCCICDEPAEDTVRSRCKHEFCRACVGGYLRSTDEPDCPRCHIPLSIDLEQPEIEQDAGLMKKSSIINRIKMEDWTSSSKIELLVHELHKMRSNNASHKSIIFSQFTTMLQLIEWRLRRAGITTVMLDGSMSPAQRQASIDHFMNNVGVECFLVSLKAGGVALNLTEASRVFIVDPWWNPAAEWQSADRCHRIGQTRPCVITRLCIEDSVESRMVMIQEKKTNMIHSTVNGDDKAMQSLTPADMQFLFRGN